jgi:hypothetical protein
MTSQERERVPVARFAVECYLRVIRNRAVRALAHPDTRYAFNDDQRIAAPRLGAMGH